MPGEMSEARWRELAGEQMRDMEARFHRQADVIADLRKNRWAAFTDDEVKAIGEALRHIRGEIRRNRIETLMSEVSYENSRRRGA
jgi:hypothetical protein